MSRPYQIQPNYLVDLNQGRLAQLLPLSNHPFPVALGSNCIPIISGTCRGGLSEASQWDKPPFATLSPNVMRGSTPAGRRLRRHVASKVNFYEHIIRNEADYERIATYILSNPVNWDQDEE